MTKPKTVSREAAPKKWQRRKDARPAEIIEAGLAEFAEKGFAGARLADVAARAGVVKGTIYRYFDNKEALFQAAVTSRIISTLDNVEELVDGYGGPTDELLKLVLKVIYEKIVASDARVLLRIIIAEGARFPDIPANYYRDSISKGMALIERIVQRGIEQGEFRDSPMSKMPNIIMGPAIFAAVWKMTFEPVAPLDLDAFMEAHVDMALNGLLR